MKKKLRVFDRKLRANCIGLILFLLVTFALIMITILFFEPAFLIMSIALFACICLIAYSILRYCLYWLVINETNIVLKSFLGIIKKVKWLEVKDIIIFDFNNAEIRSGVINVGGINAYIPKKIPRKWIFIKINEDESGENILEYFIPHQKTLPIRLQYSDGIVAEIKKYYSKTIIEKSID